MRHDDEAHTRRNISRIPRLAEDNSARPILEDIVSPTHAAEDYV